MLTPTPTRGLGRVRVEIFDCITGWGGLGSRSIGSCRVRVAIFRPVNIPAWPSYFKKFWSSNGSDLGVSPTTKVLRRVILHNILKVRIFLTSSTRKGSTGRKVRNRDAKTRISAETGIQKILILLFDNLETKFCRINKES